MQIPFVPLSKEEQASLIAEIRNGDTSKCEELYKACMDMVEKTICAFLSRVPGHVIEHDEMLSLAYTALPAAAKKFDPKAGYEFNSYYREAIKNEINKDLRNRDYLPSHVRREIKKALEAFEAIEVNVPGFDKVTIERPEAEIKGIKDEHIDKLMATMLRFSNMLRYDAMGQEENDPGIDSYNQSTVDGSPIISTEDVIEDEALKKEVREALEELESDEKDVIKYRLGFTDGKEHTFDDVQKEFGLSEYKAKARYQTGIEKLQHKMIVKGWMDTLPEKERRHTVQPKRSAYAKRVLSRAEHKVETTIDR